MEDFLHQINSALGPKEVRQFEKAITQPMGEFHKRVISPQFYQPGERMYLGLAVDKNVPGRNHRVAMTMREMSDAWHALTYFTNPLAIPPVPTIVEGEEKWVPPMDRVIWGRSQVMTFEFDQPDLDFFRQQLLWCRSSTGKLLDCQMGNLYRACSQWVDFEGITVAYSGNKSFHIHIVFDTGHARLLGIEQNIRHGLNLHWHKLLETVMQNLQPGVNPDMGMWQPTVQVLHHRDAGQQGKPGQDAGNERRLAGRHGLYGGNEQGKEAGRQHHAAGEAEHRRNQVLGRAA